MANANDPSEFHFSDAPGADISFDTLFPPDETNLGTTSAEPGTVTTPPVQTPPDKRVFFKSPTGTVYETEEDLVRGIAHKDELIERLRQKSIAQDGIDPITGKQVRSTQTPQTNDEANYAANPEKYWDDLSNAVEKKDRVAYAKITQKFLNDYTAPIVPLLTSVSETQAVEQVSREIPEFRQFVGSQDFNQVLDTMPILRNAIDNAKGNLALARELPDLYKLAYWTAQGRRAPEIARQAAVAPPTAPPPQARPTTPSQTLTPPTTQAVSGSVQQLMRTSEGRQQLIREAESKGIVDKVWE